MHVSQTSSHALFFLQRKRENTTSLLEKTLSVVCALKARGNIKG